MILLPITGHAQYAPQAGLSGSDAIPGTSSLIVGWASGCTVQRGYMDIADTTMGLATSGDSTLALGPADGALVSLGDSGMAVLTFKHPVYDGPGPDFAVFENGFRDPADSAMAFLELAFVEVSSDGVNYFRFPANSLTQDTVQIPMAGVYMDASKINNLAGKYVGGFGTPFDLSELSGTAGLDISHITHIRLIDVIGALSGHVTRDSAGRMINDPFPTTIPTSGFDLDAVGVIHEVGTGVIDIQKTAVYHVYPNPARDRIQVFCQTGFFASGTVRITDMAGVEICGFALTSGGNEIGIALLPSGTYLLNITNQTGEKWVERLVKY